MKPYVPGDKGYRRPETIADLHRPPGAPQAREVKSQKAQLKSIHRHGTSKGLKVPMAYKIGLREPKGREDDG